jgi:collagen type VII alpha
MSSTPIFVRNFSELYYLERLICCPNSVKGIQGLTGPTGVVGSTGAYGFTGDGGVIGPKGQLGTGPTGCRGCYKATSKVYGPVGVTGITGLTGPNGETGYMGVINESNPGETGYTGLTGSTGITGYTGYTGLTGYTGYTGLTGPKGVTGIKGPIGVTGPTNGMTGNNGVTGSSNQIGLIPVNGSSIQTYNINPTDSFNWNIDNYGRSSITDLSSNIIINVSGNNIIPSIFTDTLGITYQVYIFNDSGTFSMDGSSGYVDMCLIGGGGGGVSWPAISNTLYSQNGSGAGQLMFVNNYLLNDGSYNVIVGAGGINTASSGIGNSGVTTSISKLSQILFGAAGGAGAQGNGNNTINFANGVSGNITIDSSNTNILSAGTSSGSGCSTIAISNNYSINPYLNLDSQIWSYGNNGGTGTSPALNIGGGGGGGGAGGQGMPGSGNTLTNGIGGIGGIGLVIYFDSSSGRAVCGGGSGTGTSITDPSYGSVYPYAYPSPNPLYNYLNTNPPSGYPYPYSYGAGRSYCNTIPPFPDSMNAAPNTGSGGGSYLYASGSNSGNGGSGLFMIRYKIN